MAHLEDALNLVQVADRGRHQVREYQYAAQVGAGLGRT
jgi:hypothetical protein